MEVNFVSSRDGDVAPESEEYEQVENEGEPNRGEHEEVLCCISLCLICGCDPAPVASDSIIGSSLRVSDEFSDASVEHEDNP